MSALIFLVPVLGSQEIIIPRDKEPYKIMPGRASDMVSCKAKGEITGELSGKSVSDKRVYES